jgi:predicted PurR-regulated permease PerM
MIMNARFKIILNTFLILGSLYFLFMGLIHGKNFLIPITTAIILSMLMNPVASWFMRKGIGRVWAVLLSDIMIVVFISFMVFLLVKQVSNVVERWPEVEKNVQPHIRKAQKFYEDNVTNQINSFQNGGSQGSDGSGEESSPGSQGQPDQQDQNQSGQQDQDQQQNQGQQQDQGGNQQDQGGNQQNQQQDQGQSFDTEAIRGFLIGFISNVFSFLTDMLLILVYIFFFMFYQKKFENAIIGMVSENEKEHTRQIIRDSSGIAQKYLFGRFILITILAVLYMIAFSIIGLEHAILVSLLSALFSLLPFIGNIIAIFLALGMSFIGDGGTTQIIAIIISFTIIQFIESYLLEPYVVGKKVDLNPVVIIVGIVLGGLIWGVMGMILVIPVLGIIKVIFDSIESLRPLGYVLDERDVTSNDEPGWQEKIKEWFRKKFK